MHLGISSYTYTWAVGVPGHVPPRPMGAVDLLERAAQLGVRLVQVADNLPLDRLAPEALDRLAQRAVDLGMAIEVGTRGIAPDHLLLYLELAVRFRSPILRVVVDTADCHPPEAEVVATLRPLMPAFERAGVCLAIENHDRFPARTLAWIVEQVGSPSVGICLDTANSFAVLEGPEHVVRELGPWAVNLHVKGFVVQRARHMMGFTIEGCPVGQGQLDVPWLLQALRDLGRDPNAVLEQWTSPEESLAETIAREARWAAESIAYLRQWIPE